MAYATISTWKMADGGDMTDEVVQAVQNGLFPALKSAGANSTYFVQTDSKNSAVVTVWPDEATRSAAMGDVEAVRQKARDQLGAEMTGEMKGEVLAS